MSLRILERAVRPLLRRIVDEVLLRLNEPSLLLTPDLRVIRANPWFRDSFLRDGEEPEGETLFSIAGGAFDSPELHRLLDEVAAAGPVHQRPLRVTLPGIGSRSLQVGIVPIRGGSFVSPYTVLVAHDDTEQRQIADERARLVQAVEHAYDAVVITDRVGQIEFANPAFEVATGIQRNDAVGRLATTVLQLSARTLARLVAGVRRQGYWSGVISGWRRDGGPYEIEVVASEVRGPDGDTTGYVAVGRDRSRELTLERRIETERADRARLAFALARLRSKAGPEETAAALCDEIARLPWVKGVAIINLAAPGGAIPVAVNAPLGAPLRRDIALPVSVTARLRERLASGAWTDDLASGHQIDPENAYLEAWWRLGVTTLANAPLHGEAGPSTALLTVAARLSGDTEELAVLLPTIVELGAFAGAMVVPKLEQHNGRVLAQRRIWNVVDRGAFRPVFQPIVNLASEAVVGFEALTRFDDGTPPEELFAEARSVGLEVVLERACIQAALAASGSLPEGAWLSLNVSPSYLQRRSGRDPLGTGHGSRRLVVEITESSAIEDYGRLRETISRLRDQGVAVAVDDAGVGFDSLRRLLELRPDFIKLDRSLIRSLARDRVQQALVSAMAQFARDAGAEIIAEGVERSAQRDALVRLGVPLGQGFLLGRPASSDGVTDDGQAAAGVEDQPLMPAGVHVRRRQGRPTRSDRNGFVGRA